MNLLGTIRSPADLKALPPADLVQVCAEIRHAICEQVSKSGGHLAPNLGVVELTVAMHYVFDFSYDRLLFDVGHQCYTHKLLTGRQHLLPRLRQRGGMSGFPEPRESNFDLFTVGHAGTAIPTAVGMARGDSLNGEGWTVDNPNGRRTISLIGDASIVNGVAMEGLNNAGTLKRQFLVILNDNGMSIAKPQGAVSAYFDRLRLSHTYGEFKKRAKEMARHMPGGDRLKDLYHRMGESSKAFIAENHWFEHFGLVTVGPIDGHDLPTLIDFLNEAKHFDHPMVLHVKTIKGKGFEFAENDACAFHSPSAFKIETMENEGCKVEMKKGGRSFTAAFGDILSSLMERDPKVVACTAAMPDGTGINKVIDKFPTRVWDSGICESHAFDMMAGLAKTGWKPFFAVYSTFLQRAFDQAFQEAALQGLPVRLCLDRSGLVGGDGAVHHGFCDIALLSVLPKACIMAAMDESSLKACINFMNDYSEGISSVRYPRDNVSPRFENVPCPPFELGKARQLVGHKNPDAAILTFGVCAIDAAEALTKLDGEYAVELYDGRFAKPIDEELLRRLLTAGTPIITVEDHSIRGGFGAAVLETCNALGLDTRLVTRMALPDQWIYQGERKEQLAEAGIDGAAIARTVRAILEGQLVTEASPAVVNAK
ncbi:MAG: 1-deoxy-D-xylulose-5-phosphate synthase [Planctomycetota bacterium]|nr:1-deoxy-D-xylulose-5-phosphate synthase [Planctomycetota bacterium]MDA1262030.1 1-deoxy-D-xylulose-5-phosphate synthase [Planctomycetota bacterium]